MVVGVSDALLPPHGQVQLLAPPPTMTPMVWTELCPGLWPVPHTDAQ
jgi:hypothetical protein